MALEIAFDCCVRRDQCGDRSRAGERDEIAQIEKRTKTKFAAAADAAAGWR